MLKNVSGQLSLETWSYPKLMGDGRWCIYAIFDPRSCRACYIGKCANGLKQRWCLHLGELRRGVHGNIRLQRLFAKLKRLGLGDLCCRPIEFCDLDHLPDREVHWITGAKKAGFDLCNFSNGGGTLGIPCSEEKRRKISQAKIGKPNVFTPEGMKSFLEKQRARVPTGRQLDALRMGRSDPRIVKKNRDAVVAAARARKGKPISRCAVENIREANAKLSEDKVMEARTAYWSSKEKRGIASRFARKFGVTLRTMLYAIVGATWKTVPMPGSVSC